MESFYIDFNKTLKTLLHFWEIARYFKVENTYFFKKKLIWSKKQGIPVLSVD